MNIQAHDSTNVQVYPDLYLAVAVGVMDYKDLPKDAPIINKHTADFVKERERKKKAKDIVS